MRLARVAACLALAVLGAAPCEAGAPRWHVVATAPSPLPLAGSATAILPDGRMLLIGVATVSGNVPSRVTLVFDPRTLRFEPGPLLVVPRLEPAAVAVGLDRVLVAGGTTTSFVVATDTAEVVDLAASRSEPTGRMGVRRGQSPLLVRAGEAEAVIFGGVIEGRFAEATGLVERWSAETGEWTVEGRMELPCYLVQPVIDGSVVVRSGGQHRCCGDPVNAACEGWTEIWDLGQRRSALVPQPRDATGPCGWPVRLGPGELRLSCQRAWLRLARTAPAETGPLAGWTTELLRAGVVFPIPTSAPAPAVLAEDDLLLADAAGLMLVHPLSGRPWECLDAGTFDAGNTVGLGRGLVLLLPRRPSERRAMMVASEEALRDLGHRIGSALVSPPGTPRSPRDAPRRPTPRAR